MSILVLKRQESSVKLTSHTVQIVGVVFLLADS